MCFELSKVKINGTPRFWETRSQIYLIANCDISFRVKVSRGPAGGKRKQMSDNNFMLNHNISGRRRH